MSKITVIHHSADFDGLFCREIARKFLPDAEFIGWDFKDDPIEIPFGDIYVLDLPVDRVFGLKFPVEFFPLTFDLTVLRRIIWIDHHKSSIESHPTDIPGYRIDGVAACRLAWQWFTKGMEPKWNGENGERIKTPNLPTDVQFKNREVSEPWAVRLAGEYDIWDKRDPNAELFQHGLRSEELYHVTWDALLSDDMEDEATVTRLLNQGRALQFARTKENESIIKEMGFTIQFEGLTFLCCNAARYNSHLFTAGLEPFHDACLGFKWTGKDWSVSLYHAPGKEHHDLSLIATKYGGGGHRGACGYRTNKLPFLA